jgi:hypothetical protein
MDESDKELSVVSQTPAPPRLIRVFPAPDLENGVRVQSLTPKHLKQAEWSARMLEQEASNAKFSTIPTMNLPNSTVSFPAVLEYNYLKPAFSNPWQSSSLNQVAPSSRFTSPFLP